MPTAFRVNTATGKSETVVIEVTPEFVPTVVTMRQARLALLGAGLLSTINTAIDSMTGTDGEAANIQWEYAQEVYRDSPLILSVAGLIGLTTEQVDALFIAAGDIA